MQGEFYNRYNTPLTPEERKGLYQFLMDLSMQERRNAYSDLNDYDMAGAYLAGAMEPGGNGHFTDEWKKPNHPTFSQESRYNGVDGYSGGVWAEDGSGETTFTPSAWNLENMPPEEMQRYFGIAEPDARLVLPGNGGGNKDMAVQYVQNGGGGGPWGLVGSLLSLAVPGAAPWIAGAKAVGSAVKGDYGGAVKQAAGLLAPNIGGGSNGKIPSLSGSSPADLTGMLKQNLSNANPTALPDFSKIPDNLSDMGTRYVGNRMQSPGFVSNLIGGGGNGYRLSDADKRRYDELLVQYGLSDMDYSTRQRRNMM